jgi:hypothetical protein
LAARSPVFAAQLAYKDSTSNSKANPIINIGDVEFSTMEKFLKFLYTGELAFPLDEKLLTLAQDYGTETLVKLCNLFLKYDGANGLMDLAILMNTELKSAVESEHSFM